MGEISEKLVTMIRSSRSKKVVQLRDYAKGKQFIANEVKDVQQLVDKGYNPLHAIYVSAQNLVSLLAELFSELSLFKEYYEIVDYAEDLYMPDGPPISPLTRSYFTTWAFFDVRFGIDDETIGTCVLDVGEDLKIPSDMSEVIRLFQNSRMGVYRHCGKDGKNVVLKELGSKEEYPCYVGSQYFGQKGELWFVRRLPPTNDLFDYSLIFTTPYVLANVSEKSWLEYINRTLLKIELPDKKEALHHLMKYGLETNYWNEYIFLAFHHAQNEAIFLSGIPDIKESLPHADFL